MIAPLHKSNDSSLTLWHSVHIPTWVVNWREIFMKQSVDKCK